MMYLDSVQMSVLFGLSALICCTVVARSLVMLKGFDFLQVIGSKLSSCHNTGNVPKIYCDVYKLRSHNSKIASVHSPYILPVQTKGSITSVVFLVFND